MLNVVQLQFTTVVQKLYQGTIPQSGRIRLRVSFFVTFLDKQKSKIKNLKMQKRSMLTPIESNFHSFN